jgi:hypothetical protein
MIHYGKPGLLIEYCSSMKFNLRETDFLPGSRPIVLCGGGST